MDRGYRSVTDLPSVEGTSQLLHPSIGFDVASWPCNAYAVGSRSYIGCAGPTSYAIDITRRMPLAHGLHRMSMQSCSNPINAKEVIMNLKLTALKLTAASVALAIAFLAGCNTMEGAGKDIKKGGESIENSANKSKNSSN
jgi:entericidin B